MPILQFPLVSGFEGNSFKSDKVWRKTFAGFSQVRVNSNCSLICFEFFLFEFVSKRWTSKTSAPSFKLKMFSRPFARVNYALIHSCAHRRKLSKVSTSFPQRFRLPFNYTHLTQKSLFNEKPSRHGVYNWFLVLDRHVASTGIRFSPRPKINTYFPQLNICFTKTIMTNFSSSWYTGSTFANLRSNPCFVNFATIL